MLSLGYNEYGKLVSSTVFQRWIDRIFVVTQGGDTGYLVRPHDDIVRGAVSNCFRSRATWLWYMAENMTRPGTQIR